MSALELKIPPPAQFLLAALLAWAIARLAPAASLPLPAPALVGTLLLLAGVASGVLALVAFRRQRTTIDPHRPEAATSLVRGGVYRISRNPMYLGLLLVLCAVVAWLANAASALALPAFIASMTRWQIMPEERILQRKFGAEYSDYCRRVRRWL